MNSRKDQIESPPSVSSTDGGMTAHKVQNGCERERSWFTGLQKAAIWGLSFINGFLGDHLEQKQSSLAQPMQLYHGDNPLDLTHEALARDIDRPSPKVVILVHGLACNEYAWSFFNPDNEDYGSLLQRDLGYTPLYLRYNSGRHISCNGKELAQLLQRLQEVYPEEIQEIILLGHSTGGLIIRSACHYAENQGCTWVSKVSRIFLLGVPNLGAPLEKLVNVASAVLKEVKNPYTMLASGILNLRSSGVKDLRFGYLVDEDWQDSDPDEVLKNNRNPIPLLKGADHYILAGTLTADPSHLATRWFGDSLVRIPSALGQAQQCQRTIAVPPEQCRVFASLNHYDLAYHPAVYQQILTWCGGQLPMPREQTAQAGHADASL